MDELAELFGESPTIGVVRDKLRRLLDRQHAGQRLPAILLQGDTGTGKGLVARLLHRHSLRRLAPFIDVNCAAIPDTLLEAELFGFERGAFTDAHHAKPGLFQAAHGGVLFLDEVALLPDSVQAKLLTAVEERTVRRLGSTRPEPADVWLVSATNTDLTAAVRARRFREDLYYRLAVLTVTLPPLRDRGQDILLLAERFLARACAEYGLPPKRFDTAARARLLAYSWPGNVRELGNVIERAALFADTAVLTADSLGSLEAEEAGATTPVLPPGTLTNRDEAMRQHLLTALERTGWNISRTATLLRITRHTVYARLEKFGLRPASPRKAGSDAPRPVERSAEPPSPDTRLQWEQRSLSLLRADLSNTDRLDGWSQASRTLDAVIAKVHTFGGRVEEMTPTGVVAAFGLEPAEDAPRRAAHAAMTIQKGAARARGRGEKVPEITIALHVAPVLIGRVGTRIEIDARAKRAQWGVLDWLLQAQVPDETVASGAAAPFLERRFELARMEAGDGHGEAVYRLTGQERRGFGLWGSMTRFVGRQDELGLLRSRLALGQVGHGQMVAIIGEAGVGKSRLLYELAAAQRREGWQVLEGAAVSYGQAMSYLPVIDLLKAYFTIQDRDDIRGIRGKITEKVLTVDPALNSALPALLALLDVPVDDAAWRALDPSQRRQRTLEAIRRLLLRETHEHPLLLIFEDLHWVDSETQALLDNLVESLPTAPLLLLVSYRPEYQHRWGSKTYYRQLYIDPLPAESADDLLTSLIGTDTSLDLLKRTLIARTEGNPLFLEESVRTLVETRVLTGERGAYRLAHDTGAIEIPATVQAILAARIDRLSPEDKRLLQAAAVIGKDVPFTLLLSIAELVEEDLRRGLAHLQAAEFLYETSLLPDLGYTFKHSLTHEVAYGSLLQEPRRMLHARIVEVVEAFSADRISEQVERLAHHTLRGEVWDKALAYCRHAGERAMARSAYREAVGYFEQALTVLPHLPETRVMREQAIDLRLALRSALAPAADFGRVLEWLREAEALATVLNDRRRLGQISIFLSLHFSMMGAYDQAIAAAQRALALAIASGDVILRALASRYLGEAYHIQGDYRRAIDCSWQTVVSLDEARCYEHFGQVILPAVTARARLALCHAELGAFAEGRTLGEEGLRIAEVVAHPASLMNALWGIGLLALRQGDLPRALPLLERAMNFCKEADFPHFFPWTAAALGAAYTLAGRVADAVPLLTQAMAQTTSTGMIVYEALCRLPLGEAHMLAGRLEEGHALAERALALACKHLERGNEAYARRLLGEIAARHDPPEAEPAEAFYTQALASADELGMRPLVAHCHFGLGKLSRRTGKREQAQQHLTTATTMYREMDMRFYLEQADAERGA